MSGQKLYRSTPAYVYLIGTWLAAAFILGAFGLFGALTRPDGDRERAEFSAVELAAIEAPRRVTFTPDDQYALHVDVGEPAYAAARAYAAGPHTASAPPANWYPRGRGALAARSG